ncbi:hypothetical protein HKX48_006617 [Thoreauomyces humboldtii]|nr:hypothetical protein HKX48_006617 [Thoreauomyces humboldtii]
MGFVWGMEEGEKEDEDEEQQPQQKKEPASSSSSSDGLHRVPPPAGAAGTEAAARQRDDREAEEAEDEELELELEEASSERQSTAVTEDLFEKRTGFILCTSYLFTTWNVRADEWAVAVFLAYIFPGTLLPVSLHAFVVTLAAILLSSRIGRIVDKTPRLRAVREFLILQKIMIAASALALFVASESPGTETWTYSALTCVCTSGVVLKLSNIGTTISVEKDWVVVLGKGSSAFLTEMNSHLRRIDLSCKVVAPLFVSLLTVKLPIPYVMIAVAAVSVLTIPVEWGCMSIVFDRTPLLAEPKHGATPSDSSNALEAVEVASHSDMPASVPQTAISDNTRLATQAHSTSTSSTRFGSRLVSQTMHSFGAWRRFAHHKVFLSSLAISQLYFTVLSFGPVMISYLLLQGYTSAFLAGMRAVAVIAGLAATFAMPRTVRKIGLVRTGLWAVWSQAISVLPAAVSFWMPRDSHVLAAVMLFGGTISSRFGLWSFDLVQTQMMQEMVDAAESGAISGRQSSMQNFFDLLASAATIIWSSPDSFWIPATISVGAVISAAVTFSVSSFLHRGHLFHYEKLLRWDVQNAWTRRRRRHLDNEIAV